MSDRKRLFRFSLRTLLLVTCGFAIVVAYFVSRVPHCRAVTALKAANAELVWIRETPSWLDKQLGDWRLDRVRKVTRYDVSEFEATLERDLNYLEEFDLLGASEGCASIKGLLKHKKTLRTLRLPELPQSDGHVISKFKNLDHLVCAGELDLDLLSPLKKLTTLDLTFAKPTNVDSIRNLQNLKSLYLETERLETIEPTLGLRFLEELHLSNCRQLRSIEGIGQLKYLRELQLGNTQIMSCLPLAELANLEELSLPPEIDDLRFLRGLSNLKGVYGLLEFLNPDNLSVLDQCDSMERMVLLFDDSEAQIDLKQFSHMKNLKSLTVQRLSDTSDLALFPKLERLSLCACKVETAGELLKLPGLNSLKLMSCEMPSKELAKLRIGLKPETQFYVGKHTKHK